MNTSNSCPRCGGSGKLPFRNAGGVCFKCNGVGFLPALNADERREVEEAMDYHRNRLARLATLPAAPAPAPATDEDVAWFWSLFQQT